jgi:hypothetical protein
VSAAFLRAPFGARAAALGGADAAGAQGAEALFQNPAALARLEPASPSEAAFGYDALLASSYQGGAAYARPWGSDGALGAGVVYASQPPQTAYDAFGNASGSFTPLDAAAGAGYARRLGSLLIGAGIKAVRSTLGGASGTSVAADLGVVARHATDLGDSPIDVGAAISNLGPPLKLGSVSSPLPLSVRGGALWHASANVDAAADFVCPVDADPYAAVGVEARFPQSAGRFTPSLRAGYNQNAGRGVDGFAGFAFGGGLDFAALRLDYAWQAFGALGASNRVTLAFRF